MQGGIILGRELAPGELPRKLATWVRLQGYENAGALVLTCADETERECAELFQSQLLERILPRLKMAHYAPFRLANLGARYEPGALAIAQDHFVMKTNTAAPTLVIVKLSSHVAVDERSDGLVFGQMQRYGTSSTACGGLCALLAGTQGLPCVEDLHDTFRRGGIDRLAALLDPERVPPEHRAVLAAVCNSLLQASRVIDEIGGQDTGQAVHYLVLSTVTMNRPGNDTELLCGWRHIRLESGSLHSEVACLPDDPAQLQVTIESKLVTVEERGDYS